MIAVDVVMPHDILEKLTKSNRIVPKIASFFGQIVCYGSGCVDGVDHDGFIHGALCMLVVSPLNPDA